MGSVCDLRGGLQNRDAGTAVYHIAEVVACFGVFNDESEDVFVSRNQSALYTLGANTTQNREKPFTLVQGLPFNVIPASRTFWKSFLENIHSALLSSEVFTMADKNE